MAKTLRTSGDYTIKAGDGFDSGSGTNTITLDSLNVSVNGNLTVGGTSTTVSTTNTTIEDNIIELNTGASANTNSAGIIIERGTAGDNAALLWKEDTDSFIFGTTTATAADKSSAVSVTAGDLEVSNLTAGKVTTNEITANGSNAALTVASSGTGDVTIDSGGDLIVDVDNADLILKDDGTEFGRLSRVTADFVIKSSAQDKDLIFKGNDNGATVTPLTLDMSEGGDAIFGAKIVTNGNRITHAQAGTVSFMDFTVTQFGQDNNTVLSSVKSINMFLDSNGGDTGQAFRIYNNTNPDGSPTESTFIFKIQEDGDMFVTGDTSMTGTLTATDITANSLTTNTITSNGSNAELSLQASGTGDVVVSALRVNGTTLDSADSTKITVAEDVDVTGTLFSRGNVFGVQTLTGSGSTGVISLTDTVTLLITTGGSQAFSLADGVEGQLKIISMKTDGGTGIVTPANFVNGTQITFDDVQDTITLLYQSTGWVVLARQNALVS